MAFGHGSAFGEGLYGIKGVQSCGFEAGLVDFLKKLNHSADVVLCLVASTLVQAKERLQSIESVVVRFQGQTSGEHHAAETALSGGGHSQSCPFRFQASIPVIAQVMGDQRIILGILAKGGVDLAGVPAILFEVFPGVAVDGRGLVRDVDVVVEEHAENRADGLPAFHELAAQFDHMDRIKKAIGLRINDYPSCSVFHVFLTPQACGRVSGGCKPSLSGGSQEQVPHNDGAIQLALECGSRVRYGHPIWSSILLPLFPRRNAHPPQDS